MKTRILFSFIFLFTLCSTILSSLSYGNQNWVLCADEGETCQLPYTTDVRYGVNGHYNIKSGLTGSVNCDNPTFGDARPGVPKQCWYKEFSTVAFEPLSGRAVSAYQARMAAVSSYWTPEAIASAVPRHIELKRIPRVNPRANAAGVMNAHSLRDPSERFIKLGNRHLLVTIDREALPPGAFSRNTPKYKLRPKVEHLSPMEGAELSNQSIDIVANVNSPKELSEIVLLIDDFEYSTEVVFKDEDVPFGWGSGRYTFSLKSLNSGFYRWRVIAKDVRGKVSREGFGNFSVNSVNSANSESLENFSGGITSTVNFKSISPASGAIVQDPVVFEWQVTPAPGETILLVLLYVSYPDGHEAYMTRPYTADGRDSVSLTIHDEGQFSWSVWAQTSSGRFTEGPWQSFTIPEMNHPNCTENLGRYTDRESDLHKASGRLLFNIGPTTYLCSATLVEGANDRVVIATAAHCLYDLGNPKTFASNVMFIPGQDDGETDTSDQNCANDPHGCFYPTVGVISQKYKDSPFAKGFEYDYGFLVAQDFDLGPDNQPYFSEASLRPMGITFEGMNYKQTTHLFGYPGNRDSMFMYTSGRSEASPITENGGWYVQCSGLSGGASGGAWTQSDISTGFMVLGSVNSWGWSNGDAGMGSPPFDIGAKCVYDRALAEPVVPFDSGGQGNPYFTNTLRGVTANCPTDIGKTPGNSGPNPNPNPNPNPDSSPPAVPNGLSATAGNGSVSLNWANNSESDLAGYHVYRSTNSGNNGSRIRSSLSNSSFTDSGLNNGTTYYYRVKAVDNSGNESGFSSRASARPQDAADIDSTPPAVPNGLSATAGNGSVSLNWANNSESDLAGYHVYRSTNSGNNGSRIRSSLSNSSFTDSGLNNGMTYYYRVKAVDNSGNESGFSSRASARPQDAADIDSTPPAVPNGLSATAGNGSVSLNWANNSESDFAGYNIYRRISPDLLQTLLKTNVNVSAYNDASVQNGKTYDYYVSAVDINGNESSRSAPVTVTPKGSANQPFTVKFLEPTNGRRYTEGDNIRVQVSVNPIQSVSLVRLFLNDRKYGSRLRSGPFEWTLSNMSPGTYQLKIKAKHKNSKDVIYEYVSFTVDAAQDLPPLAAPTGLTATAGDGSVSLNWANNKDANFDSYNIYRATNPKSLGMQIDANINNSQYDNVGLVNGTTYYYTVTAVDTNGNESAYSNQVSVTPQASVSSLVLNTSPGNESTFKAGQFVKLEVTASPANKVSEIKLYINSKLENENSNRGDYYVYKSFQKGRHFVSFHVIDKSGEFHKKHFWINVN